jgi:penicillin-binding protein 2A
MKTNGATGQTSAGQTPTPKQGKKRSGLRIFWKTVGFLSLAIFMVFVVAGIWAFQKGMDIYEHADISTLGKEPPRPTLIYDGAGSVVTELSNSRMEYIPYSQFPKTMVDAIISVEDSRFYEHQGVDIKGMGRALYMDLRHRSVVQGGSTITQQLAKVMLFSPEQTIERKINEAVAAMKIEKTYSKAQILEMYLNYIYYGEGANGLQRAAQIYFGKDASELGLAESAMLAGLPKAPSNYSPVDNPERAKVRRNLVLSLMAEQGRISPSQRDKAMAEPIRVAEKSVLAETNKYASYVDHVLHEATEKFGLTEQEVLTSGLKIYTNLDPRVQEAAEAVYGNPQMFPENKGGLQSAIVVLDAKTGGIRGLVGGLGENRTFRGFNYATQLKRQPGSALKPIIAYAPALMMGYKPGDMIDDAETDFNGYKPNNYGDKFHGWVTMEEALAQSYNVPAVAMLKEVGIGQGMDFAKKAGIPLTPEDRTFGIALGGMQEGTSPLTMAQAYTMFANGGIRSDAYAISKIADRNGKVIKEIGPVGHKLLEPSVAYTMTTMLQKVVSQGTGTSARMNGPVAGKTGTTQLPDVAEFKDKRGNQIDGSKDAWFVGYTPELVAAVWLGYPNTNRDHYLTTTGGKYPAAIFREVLTRALKGQTVTAFARPNGYRLPKGEVKRINGTFEEPVLVASVKGAEPSPSADVLAPIVTESVSPSPSAGPGEQGTESSPTPNTGKTGEGDGKGVQSAGGTAGDASGAGTGSGASTAPSSSAAPTPATHTPKTSPAPAASPTPSPPAVKAAPVPSGTAPNSAGSGTGSGNKEPSKGSAPTPNGTVAEK